jgi:hypothetical protein
MSVNDFVGLVMIVGIIICISVYLENK